MLNRALRLIRNYHQLSQIELAKKLEVSNTYLCEIEKGVKAPSMELLSKYSETFKMPVSTILLFSERIESHNKSTDKIRVVAAEKILKLLEWIDDRDMITTDA